MINIGIIGFGYWGPNLVRNFSIIESCKILGIAELRAERRIAIKKNYPSTSIFESTEDVLNNPEIDAIVIATPVFTHFDLAKKALENGKHVLIEKPMTSTAAEAETLIQIAKKKNLVLMVDHTFLYTGAVQKMKFLIENSELGDIKYFDSTRINLGLFQPDVNVLWDLAPHDISILNFLIKERPKSVNATGVSHTSNGIENIAYLTLNYSSDFVAHFSCSWSSPVKLRNLLIGGTKKMLLFNDLEPTEKVKVYDTGYSVKTDEERTKLLVDYRIGDIHIPKLAMTEALQGVAKDFIDSIGQNKEPISNADSGLQVIKILEAAQKSIKSNGKEINL